MPFVFIVIGVLFLVSGVRDTSSDLVTLLHSDLTGKSNFFYWILSILILGSLGYIKGFQPFSRAFLILVLLVLILSQQKSTGSGFFEAFQSALTEISNRKSSNNSSLG